jgi:hypothetical protein
VITENNVDLKTYIFDWEELDIHTITNLYLYGTVNTRIDVQNASLRV